MVHDCDTQHTVNDSDQNGIQPNDTQNNDRERKGLKYNSQHTVNDIQQTYRHSD